MLHAGDDDVMRRLLAALLLIGCSIAYARDPARPDLDKWFDGLRSKAAGGLCCMGSEAAGLTNNDWESKNGKYRVFIFGQWHDVPPDAVVTVPNLDGRTLVWASKGAMNNTIIRCFLPGAMS
jgi:hypothetical protein